MPRGGARPIAGAADPAYPDGMKARAVHLSWRVLAPLAVFLGSLPVLADPAVQSLTCLRAPYESSGNDREQRLETLVDWLQSALVDYDSLVSLLEVGPVEFCLGDGLFGMQGYCEVETGRIVLRSDLSGGLMGAVAIHELRHVQQHQMGVCLDPGLSMHSSARLVLAMEADASAITAGIAWGLRSAGQPEVWAALEGWPSQNEIVGAFAKEMEQSADMIRATERAFSAWYEVDDLREVYYNAACSAYLDRQDLTHALPEYGVIGDAAFRALCRLPDGTAYACDEPGVVPKARD